MAGEIQGADAVEVAVEVLQILVGGQIQAGQPVGDTAEHGQPGILGHIQLRQVVVGAIQALKIGEGAQPLQAGQAQSGQVQLGHGHPLLLGEHAVSAGAPQIGGIEQPALELLIPEGFGDVDASLIAAGCQGCGRNSGKCELTGEGDGGQHNGHLFHGRFHLRLLLCIYFLLTR